MTYYFVKRRLLTEEEKYRRAIFFYTFDDYSFEHIYEDDNNLNDEYGQPLLKIKENFDRLDDKTKSLVLEFVKREVYDETVDLKNIALATSGAAGADFSDKSALCKPCDKARGRCME